MGGGKLGVGLAGRDGAINVSGCFIDCDFLTSDNFSAEPEPMTAENRVGAITLLERTEKSAGVPSGLKRLMVPATSSTTKRSPVAWSTATPAPSWKVGCATLPKTSLNLSTWAADAEGAKMRASKTMRTTDKGTSPGDARRVCSMSQSCSLLVVAFTGVMRPSAGELCSSKASTKLPGHADPSLPGDRCRGGLYGWGEARGRGDGAHKREPAKKHHEGQPSLAPARGPALNSASVPFVVQRKLPTPASCSGT